MHAYEWHGYAVPGFAVMCFPGASKIWDKSDILRNIHNKDRKI